MVVISISLPESLLERGDGFIEERGYAGRSELFRSALRDFLAREAELDDGAARRNATLTMTYPHGVERKVSEARHDFNEIVEAMMHGHSEEACVEVFMLSGETRRIRAFVDALRAIREVRMVEATFTDVAAQQLPD